MHLLGSCCGSEGGKLTLGTCCPLFTHHLYHVADPLHSTVCALRACFPGWGVPWTCDGCPSSGWKESDQGSEPLICSVQCFNNPLNDRQSKQVVQSSSARMCAAFRLRKCESQYWIPTILCHVAPSRSFKHGHFNDILDFDMHIYMYIVVFFLSQQENSVSALKLRVIASHRRWESMSYFLIHLPTKTC